MERFVKLVIINLVTHTNSNHAPLKQPKRALDDLHHSTYTTTLTSIHNPKIYLEKRFIFKDPDNVLHHLITNNLIMNFDANTPNIKRLTYSKYLKVIISTIYLPNSISLVLMSIFKLTIIDIIIT